jgi:MoxR-like ATPase
MQEQQVTIGGESYAVPSPFLVLATQNPIESEGTYALPEAQVDRFLFKLMVDYPDVEDEVAVARGVVSPAEVRQVLSMDALVAHRARARDVLVDREVARYAVQLVDATRHPERHDLGELSSLIAFGGSPRASIGLVQSAQALALLRDRTFATVQDVADLARDVLRHRLVLTYDALADGVTPDALIDRILEAVAVPRAAHLAEAAA